MNNNFYVISYTSADTNLPIFYKYPTYGSFVSKWVNEIDQASMFADITTATDIANQELIGFNFKGKMEIMEITYKTVKEVIYNESFY